MLRPALFLLGLTLVALLAAWWLGHLRFRARMAEAESAWAAIATGPAATATFDPASLADQPEIARRYFNHAIAPDTALARSATLRMQGTFLLNGTGYAMQARQILAPPEAFVWIAAMQNGPIRFSGSDGLHAGHGWTRFWMFGAVPLVQVAATPDLDRAAMIRPALEAIWAPASLLPQFGSSWVQTGPDSARVTLTNGTEIALTLAPDGAVQSVSAQRWSDANPEKVYRLQPFGGTVSAEATFAGFTIPATVRVGNHFGTAAFDGFFTATITSATYR